MFDKLENRPVPTLQIKMTGEREKGVIAHPKKRAL